MEETKKILALFPGQGSQKVGMGADLFARSPVAGELFETADRALGFPLSKICFEGPADKLTETAIAQPAILTVSSIAFQIASDQELFQTVSGAGHSLGEYSALVAAGAISFEDAVLLVHKRGSYMQEAVPQGLGKMVAILGRELAEVEEAAASIDEGVCEVANINAPGQIVVAGQAEAVDLFVDKLGGAKVIPLQVSAPFHCALMKPAADSLAKDLAATSFSPASFPIYANFSARGLSEPEEIRQSLVDQVCGRVRWVDCMKNAIAETSPQCAVEFGAGNTLTGMLKRIDPSIERINFTG